MVIVNVLMSLRVVAGRCRLAQRGGDALVAVAASGFTNPPPGYGVDSSSVNRNWFRVETNGAPVTG